MLKERNIMNSYDVVVVVDPQNDFISGSLAGSMSDIPNTVYNLCNYLLDFFQQSYNNHTNENQKVFVTLDKHDENYLDTVEGHHLPIKHCINGTDGAEIHPIIKAVLDIGAKEFDISYIEKSSFGSLELSKQILELIQDGSSTIKSITLVGFCTDICVISNALLLKTCLPNTEIYVREDCCSGTTRQAHNEAIKIMSGCHVNILK